MVVKQLSVFFPAFNEEGNIVTTAEKAVAVLEKLDLNYEVIIINDGSRDRTSEVSHELAKKNKHVKVVDQENGGYGMALRAGFKNAKYDWIVYTDGDGQFDFSEIGKFLKKADEGNDYIIGYRIKRNDPFYRVIFAKIWALSVFFLFWIWVRDIDGGFKMINRRVLDKIPALKSTRGAMINAELLIKTKKYGFKIAQVGVNHYPRMAGKPTGANIKVIIQSYIELLKLWLKFH